MLSLQGYFVKNVAMPFLGSKPVLKIGKGIRSQMIDRHPEIVATSAEANPSRASSPDTSTLSVTDGSRLFLHGSLPGPGYP